MRLSIDSTHWLPGVGLFTEQEVGEEYGDLRLTDAGISNGKDGFWYFYRKWSDKENPYWYRKRRTSATDSNPEGDVVEEYVGLQLPFTVPREWLMKLRRRALSSK